MDKKKIFLVSLGHLSCDINGGALPAILPFLITAYGFDYQAAAGWKRKRIVPGAGHAMSYPADQAGCQRALMEFMDHILGNA